jgi:hypothetical protein
VLAIAAVVARTLGESGAAFSALVLAAALPNAGNFGIPVSTDAFGTVGRDVAVLFVVARGAGATGATALRRVFELPLVYVVVLSGVVLWTGAVPPADGTLLRTVGMAGDASIPLFLIVLGIQVARTDPAPPPADRAGRRTEASGRAARGTGGSGGGRVRAAGTRPRVLRRAYVDPGRGPRPGRGRRRGTRRGQRRLRSGVRGDAILLTTLGCVPAVTGLIALLRAGVLVELLEEAGVPGGSPGQTPRPWSCSSSGRSTFASPSIPSPTLVAISTSVSGSS